MKTEIGIVTLNYAESGELQMASFKPTMSMNIDKSLFEEMQGVNKVNDASVIKSNAEIVFAAWFSKLNEIELADRDNYQIVSEMVHCEYYTHNVKECQIKFTFQSIKNN